MSDYVPTPTERIAQTLERLTDIMATISDTLVDLNERQLDGLKQEYELLKQKADWTARMFTVADNRMAAAGRSGETITVAGRERYERYEFEMIEAGQALDAFEAAHPELTRAGGAS